MTRKIEISEIKNSKFTEWADETHFRVLIPPTSILKGTNKRELCIIIACKGLKFRTIDKSVENANCWLKKTKAIILRDVFDIGKTEEELMWQRMGF